MCLESTITFTLVDFHSYSFWPNKSLATPIATFGVGTSPHRLENQIKQNQMKTFQIIQHTKSKEDCTSENLALKLELASQE